MIEPTQAELDQKNQWLYEHSRGMLNAQGGRGELNDPVNHPEHYQAGGIECIDVIAAVTADMRGMQAVCTANVLKYLWRWPKKGGVESLKKARWYLDRLIREMET